MPRRTPEQAAATRRALLDAGRRLFRDKGFDNVSGEELVAAAGVTRGAMYHHFADKREVFEAVYREVLEELDAEVTKAGLDAATETGEVWPALLAGLDRYLDLCLDPDVAEFALRQAPAVLGWERWDAIDREFSVDQVKGVLELLAQTGQLDEVPVLPLAELLVGAMNQAGRLITLSDEPARARQELGPVLLRLIEGVRAPARAPAGSGPGGREVG
jgi:AcrR family transcriptional regulator